MNYSLLNHFNQLKSAIFVCSSLLGLSLSSLAHATPAVNPCPGIYYEEPHNSTRIVPNGCRPNAATLIQQGNRPFSAPSTPLTIQTFSEGSQMAIARVIPYQGQIRMRLKNNMQTTVTYQALGQTSPRSLNGGEEVLLQNLPVPMTLTVLRSDGGLVSIVPMSNAQENVLGLSFNEANGLNDSQLTVRVQSQGQVYAF